MLSIRNRVREAGMEGFRVVHDSETEVRVLHSATNTIFHFAVQEGALAPSPGLVREIPVEAEVYLSDARGTAITFLMMKRRGDEAEE
jgi:hypothetical protein